MKKLTDEQFKETLEKHRKYLLGENGGERADFVGCDLRSANLNGANLRSADLYGANLRSADLYGANLRSADLGSADLYGANLRSADLYGANLRSADLRSADLNGADLRGADLYGADLGSKTKLGRMLRLVGACQESIEWLDKQDHSDPSKLLEMARGEWCQWIADTLGGEPSMQRLQFVVDFISGGGFE